MVNQTFTSIDDAVAALLAAGLKAYLATLPSPPETPEVTLDIPRNADHGDWACSVALRLAKPLRLNPLAVAEGIAAHIPASDLIDPPTVLKPGFINLRLASGAVAFLIRDVLERGKEFGHSDTFAGRKVLVEFVSANPTGPLHIGHGRGAVVGDTLARILAAAGYDVTREYYYNDAGVQMRLLGASLRARYLQALGQDVPFLENGYKGDYMIEIAEMLKAERGDALKDTEDTQPFTEFAASHILKLIGDDLDTLRIRFDSYFSETTLHTEGKVAEVLERLRERGKIYESEGAWWLRTVDYGDEKDRVVKKSDGNYTYLAPDIAYHEHKFQRGFDRLIDVLGADHHGYIPRLKASVQALGYRDDQLDAVIVQMVGVQRGGQSVKLSTRAGDFITLKEVIDEVGADVTRFLFLTRTADSQMVFDFELAKQVSMDNPVYYVQYAHARCCSLMRKAEELGQPWLGGADADLARLASPEEKAIVRQMDRYRSVIIDIAKTAEPMPLTAYLRDLATAFHSYFTAGNRDEGLRVIQAADPALTQARLTLIGALRQVFANALELLGVVPLERL